MHESASKPSAGVVALTELVREVRDLPPAGDDAGRIDQIRLLEELRSTSQLIIITHQKPTMEVADALYGVSMRGDGVTTVISPRLRGVPVAG